MKSIIRHSELWGGGNLLPLYNEKQPYMLAFVMADEYTGEVQPVVYHSNIAVVAHANGQPLKVKQEDCDLLRLLSKHKYPSHKALREAGWKAYVED